ncbi:MAG: hypothetical protein AVDCRST_MAG48-3313, partial [uncultured Friedmanniella sp.]
CRGQHSSPPIVYRRPHRDRGRVAAGPRRPPPSCSASAGCRCSAACSPSRSSWASRSPPCSRCRSRATTRCWATRCWSPSSSP